MAAGGQLSYQAVQTRGSEYLPYIDGLRALAVLAVIIYHMNHQWLPGGFSGVDVFFVISGFVVSAAQKHYAGASLAGFATHFYARRVQRIVPAVLMFLVVASIVCALFIPGSWLSDTNEETGLYAFFGLSNFILASASNDYFSPRTDYNPFTHTWSLGVEEQFYVAFPLLFFLWAAGEWRSLRHVSTFAFVTLLIASLGVAWWFASENPTLGYYMIVSRFWELAVGVVLYQAMVLKPEFFAAIGPRIRRAALATSLLLIVVGFAFARPEAFPYPWAFAPVLGTAGLLALLGGGASGLIFRLLSGRIAVFLGRISYSLYLWHWLVIVLLRWTIGIGSTLSYFIAASATLALATASFKFVESPLRYSTVLRRQPKLAVVAGALGAITLCWAFSYEVFQHQYRLSMSVTKDEALWHSGGVDISKGACPLRISRTEIHGGELRRMDPACSARGPRGRILVIGDSHAGAYLPVLWKFSMETGTGVLLYRRQGCSYLSLFRPARDTSATCQEFTSAITTEILREARRGDVLFLPSLRLARFGDQWANFPDESARKAMSGAEAAQLRAAAVDEAVALLRPLLDKGVHVVFEAPKPIFRAPPFRCSDWFNRSNPVCEPGFEMNRADLLAYRQPVMQSYAAIASQVDGLLVWDPFPILCPGEPCRARVEGTPLFFDGDHVSGYGNMRLYGGFRNFFIGLVSSSSAPEARAAG